MKSDNSRALTEFKLRWRYKQGITNNAAQMYFVARVTFDSEHDEPSDLTLVRINQVSGISDCNITFDETSVLTDARLHTEFWASEQDYIFKPKSGRLVIKGQSKKIGAYHVSILPLSH